MGKNYYAAISPAHVRAMWSTSAHYRLRSFH